MTTATNPSNRKAPQTQKVTITTYTPGLIEGIFLALGRKLEKFPKLANASYAVAGFAKGTKNICVRSINRIKKIGFTKTHLKAYSTLQLVNLAFFAQGLIGLVSLGLFAPSFTGKVTVRHARNIKDLQVLRSSQILEKEVAEGVDVYSDLNTDEEEAKSKSKVSKFQRERVRNKSLTEAELDELLDERLNNR